GGTRGGRSCGAAGEAVSAVRLRRLVGRKGGTAEGIGARLLLGRGRGSRAAPARRGLVEGRVAGVAAGARGGRDGAAGRAGPVARAALRRPGSLLPGMGGEPAGRAGAVGAGGRAERGRSALGGDELSSASASVAPLPPARRARRLLRGRDRPAASGRAAVPGGWAVAGHVLLQPGRGGAGGEVEPDRDARPPSAGRGGAVLAVRPGAGRGSPAGRDLHQCRREGGGAGMGARQDARRRRAGRCVARARQQTAPSPAPLRRPRDGRGGDRGLAAPGGGGHLALVARAAHARARAHGRVDVRRAL
ncbi:MAG: FIG00636030: hypothetical protein, partial [uncultured Sphingomonadaceae bacterium]